jgi:hypothetical protein
LERRPAIVESFTAASSVRTGDFSTWTCQLTNELNGRE